MVVSIQSLNSIYDFHSLVGLGFRCSKFSFFRAAGLAVLAQVAFCFGAHHGPLRCFALSIGELTVSCLVRRALLRRVARVEVWATAVNWPQLCRTRSWLRARGGRQGEA